jgi:FAD/FMN-containing dehydrogenase
MPGGNVGRGIAVDLRTHFDFVAPLNPAMGTIRAGVGAVADAVEAVAGRHGRTLPFLPSSRDRCSVGGMVANNAAGARSFRFGAIRNWVESLEVVLPDGSVGVVGAPDGPVPPALSLPVPAEAAWDPTDWVQVRKNSSGYALPDADRPERLLVGSEGTLALVTAATLRTAPAPEAQGVALLGLEDLELLPVVAARAEDLGFWSCEFLHRSFLELADLGSHPEVGHLCDGMASIVLLEVGGRPVQVSDTLGAMGAWAMALGLPWTEAEDGLGRDALWAVRKAASPIIADQAARGLRSTQFIEDSVVPVSNLPAYLRGLEEILREEDVRAVFFGHAGDGNVHVNPLVDPSREGWRESVHRILDRTARLVAHLGGTLAGEHGDGRIRAPYLETIWGAANVDRFRALKGALDPRGTLNPGVILPQAGQDPLEGLGAGWGPSDTSGGRP